MNIEIRKATRDDLADVLAIYAEQDIDDGHILDSDSAEAVFDKMNKYPNYAVYIAIFENQVIGTFALLIMDNLAHMGAPSAIVEDVVVASKWRSRGVGNHMIKFAMDMAKANKCYKLVLSSSIQRDRAHKFYELLGFEKHGYSFRVEL